MFAELIFDGAFENSLCLIRGARLILSWVKLTKENWQNIELTASLAT